MHGAHRSSAAHESCGKSDAYFATSGTQSERHTPSAPPIDLHVAGTSVGFLMNGSGTHTPVAHVSRCDATPAGTWALGTQCALPIWPAVQQAGSFAGSCG